MSMVDVTEASAQRILIIDDDTSVLEILRRTLENAGYEAVTVTSGQQALDYIDRHGLPHLAVVDMLMPGMSGFEFCEAVQAYSDLPVIMLTGVHDHKSVIRGLQLYAEDYVTKPFLPREVEVRVSRVLRRIGDFSYAQKPVIDVDEHLQIDFAHQRIMLDGVEQTLTPTETKLLYILLRNAGHTLRAGFLIDRLWPLQEVQKDALRVYVHRLRGKLEPDLSQPRYIQTVQGVGYQFTRF
ncbi:MAG: response regulator transcription factor [Anaerolineae bacterium]|nr:response regulator transcription factor [Anaerolineae bacterium]